MYTITISCPNNDEKLRIGENIHMQLVGNKDYIESNIILNIDQDNTVLIMIDPPVNIPDIIIPMSNLVE